MSLQGSLRQLGLADVLQTALAGRQGNLILRRGPSRAILHVASDQLCLIEPDPIDVDILLDGFIHRGVLPSDVVETERARESDPVRLLDRLTANGLLPTHELDGMLRGAAEDAILDLLTWNDGEFRFEEGAPPPAQAGLTARVGVDIGGMLLRAAQRLDEHNAIAEQLGLEALLFIPGEGDPPVDYDGDPTPTVHGLIDGTRIIDEIAMLCGMTRFAVLRSVFACVRAGAAHLPTPEQLQHQADLRMARGQFKIARGLLLQWSSLEPADPAPLQRLAEVSKKRKRSEEQADAMHALGQLLLRQGQPEQAQSIFRDLLAMRPGEPAALEALCEASEAAGDSHQYRRSTIELARAALDSDEPQRAAQLLEPLVAMADAPIAARVIRGRAFVSLKDRDGLLSEAEAAADALGRRARKREERDAAAFFRDAIATLAPERSDLLRRFRILREGSKRSFKRVALVVALLAIAGTVGFVLWPESPSSMLTKVREAYGRGDDSTAQVWMAKLLDAYPESPEAEEAFRLQASRIERRTQGPSIPVSIQAREEVQAAVEAAEGVLGDLPTAEAQVRLETLHNLLAQREVRGARDGALRPLQDRIQRALVRIERALQTRIDVLQRARLIVNGPAVETDVLRSYLTRANAFRTDGYWLDVRATLELLDKLGALYSDDATLHRIRKTRNAADRLANTTQSVVEALDECRRILTMREVEALYETCRTEAPRLLVSGQLDEAEACYEGLARLLKKVEEDPVLKPLWSEVTKRRIAQFLKDRTSVLLEIRRGLKGAMAAEHAGDLAKAVEAYETLAKKFWYVRFENVIQLPLKIESIPTGARVFLNGVEAGVTPLVVHHAWGTQSTLTIEQTGFSSQTHLLGKPNQDISSLLFLHLEPEARWRVPVDSAVAVAPVAVGEDLVICDRSGRVSRLAAKDGRVLWAAQIRSLEGVRARPALCGSILYVPFLDGRMMFLDVQNGGVMGETKTGRPIGDPAVLEDVVLLATLDGHLLGYRNRDRIFKVALEDRPTAGLVAAHGAAWVGFSTGYIARIDRQGRVTRVDLPGRAADVVGIAPHADGLLVTKRDGTLYALNPRGILQWSKKAMGEVIGNPARAGPVAASSDTRGRALLFDIATGAPRGEIALEGEPQGGLLSINGWLVAMLRDGRLWVYDTTTEREYAHVNMGGTAHFPPAVVGKDSLAVSVDGSRIALLRLRAPSDD